MCGIPHDTADAAAPQLVSGMRTDLNLADTSWAVCYPPPGCATGLGRPASRKTTTKTGRPAPDPTERQDLPYKIELWNPAKSAVEQVLAVTANGSIGYAAFYGATREFPHRYITLRHKNRIVSR